MGMSYFGGLVQEANTIVDAHFAEYYNFVPMAEVVNATPDPDPSRQSGVVFVIMLKPGLRMTTGGIHKRATAETTLYYMARGLLTDVRRFDRFELLSAPFTNLDVLTRYEVGDSPIPIGFGRYKAIMIELPLVQPVRNMTDEIPWGGSS
jgi:hypothetical protein